MKILITGGAGFIGSHIADSLLDAGHDVVIVDNLVCGTPANVPARAAFYEMDICSPELASVFAAERPDVVCHHAANKSVPNSVTDPIYDAQVNVVGLLNVLQSSVKHGVQRVVMASSGGALAGADCIPSRETDEPSLVSPYAITKYIGEKYLRFYADTFGLAYVVLRYANVYGPRQTTDGECGVIPIFMNNLLKGRPSRLFAPSGMPLGTSRDYVYVADVCQANLKALTLGTNMVLNIGTGKEVYTADVYGQLLELAGSDLPLAPGPERPGDVRRSVLDCSRAQEALGWQAKVDLLAGLRLTLNYLRSQG